MILYKLRFLCVVDHPAPIALEPLDDIFAAAGIDAETEEFCVGISLCEEIYPGGLMLAGSLEDGQFHDTMF